MGKKGSWFSAIKRVFVPNPKEKLVNDSEKKGTKEKKKGRGRGRGGLLSSHGGGETKSSSFIPLFREPSSIEKILGEADQQKLILRPPTPSEPPKTPPSVPPRAASPRAVASPRAAPAAASPRVASSRAAAAASPRAVQQRREVNNRPEPSLRNLHLSATKIQAAYRGYMARRSFRALKGLVRLQGVVRGQNVKRQTANAMKYMQQLVRVQTQIQSRRIQMLETQRQAYHNDKEVESKWTASQFEGGRAGEEWDDSLLTKEEIEGRLQKKVEAVIKRERAMAYAYSHQLWKANPKSAQSTLMDIRSGGFPWWWNWLERQLPLSSGAPPEKQATKNNAHLTPPRPSLEPKPSPRPPSSQNQRQGLDNLDTLTPRSTRSSVPLRTRHLHTPPSRTPPRNSSSSLPMKHSKPRNSSAFDAAMKDDDSLTSCPPFSAPNYMTPTVSAKAKARAYSNPKERFPGTPSEGESKRRFSFPLTPNLGSFKWNKGSINNKDSSTAATATASASSQRMKMMMMKMDDQKHISVHSTDNMSVDSTTSMPAALGRKPFNRFV